MRITLSLAALLATLAALLGFVAAGVTPMGSYCTCEKLRVVPASPPQVSQHAPLCCFDSRGLVTLMRDERSTRHRSSNRPRRTLFKDVSVPVLALPAAIMQPISRQLRKCDAVLGEPSLLVAVRSNLQGQRDSESRQIR